MNVCAFKIARLLMKITFDIDCTPEEARSFIGLPDLKPLHDAYLKQTLMAFEQGITPEAMRNLVQGWGPMGEAGMAFWRQMLGQVAAGTGS